MRRTVLRSCCWLAMSGLIVIGVTGCTKRSRLIDERHPFFKRGEELQKQSKYREAADAYEACLRESPDSAKAHLQLGVLYEEQLGDALAASYHYRAFLLNRPAGEGADLVQRWLARSEETLVRELTAKYPGAVTVPESVVTEREKRMGQQVKDLNTLVLSLREEIRVLTVGGGTVTKPAKPASGTSATATTGGAKTTAAVERVHTVRSGDSLSRISREYYQSTGFVNLIKDANKAVLGGKDQLAIGMKLKIPPKPAASASGPTPAR